MFAIDYANKHKEVLSGTDEQTCTQSVKLIEMLITTKSWWDTVDMLASSGMFV